MNKNSRLGTQINRFNKVFLIVKLILLVTPLVSYLYFLSISKDIAQLLRANPSVILTFILSMISVYIAYLLDLSQKKLQEDNNQKFITINMILLITSQVITINFLSVLMLSWLFYMAISIYDIKVTHVVKNMGLKDLLQQGGGAMIVLTISAFCTLLAINLIK